MAFVIDEEMQNVTNIKVIGVGGGGTGRKGPEPHHADGSHPPWICRFYADAGTTWGPN